MTTRIKVLSLVFALTIGLPAFAWSGTFLYWHVRIKSALRELEDQCLKPPSPTGSASGKDLYPGDVALQQAGCRALPYLIRAAKETKNEHFYRELLSYVMTLTINPAPRSLEQGRDFRRMAAAFVIADGFDWKSKHGEFEKWWAERGDLHHPWWRVWSSNCHVAR